MGIGQSKTMAFRESLAKFEQEELNSLTKTFKALTKYSQHANNKIDLSTLQKHYYQIDQNLSNQLFRVFTNRSKENEIDYESFVIGIAMACRPSTEEVKIQYFYELFDLQGKGQIDQYDFSKALESIAISAFRLLESDLLDIGEEVLNEERIQQFVKEISQKQFKSASILSFKDFRNYLLSNNQIMDFIRFILTKEFDLDVDVPASLQSRTSATPMNLIGKSELMTEGNSRKLKMHLPIQYQNTNLILLYSSTLNGYSLTTMFHHLNNKKREVHNSTLMIVGDSDGNVFGGFAPNLWKRHGREPYGNQETFLFSILPNLVFYDSKVKGMETRNITPNDALFGFMHSNEEGIAFGGVPGYHSIFLDESFLNGKTNPTRTFGNPLFSSQASFRIETVELWGFVDKEKAKFIVHDLNEEKENKKSVLSNEENTYVLELLGKNYSSMID